jgi:geranylgeranyl reductase family protein
MPSTEVHSQVWDAVVVGAGPAGSTASALLARAGLRVALLDKSATLPAPKVCGEYVSPGCLAILGRLGLLSAVRAAGRPLYGMALHTAAGRTLRATYAYGGPASREPIHGLSIPRARLDSALLALAMTSGAVVEAGFQVNEVRRNGARLEVHGRLRGSGTCLRAHLVVGADGRHSAVARRLGAVRRHPWLDKLALVAYVTGVEREDEWAEVFLGPDRYAILNPIADGVTNVGVVADRRELPRGQDPRQSLWALATRMPGLDARLHHARFSAVPRCIGPLAHRAAVLAARDTLLVGDAAGFLDPFTGEGIYGALRSAEMAAQHVLARWTSAGAAPEALAGYARAWTREFEPKFRFATHLQRAIRRPTLAEWLVAALSRRAGLSATLLSAAGDLVPPHDLSLWHLARRAAEHPRPRA